jgi:CoA:oxalate CoA-transferase
MSLTGHPGQPPARVGVSIGDLAAGLFLTVGITSALLRRHETGVGAMVDVAMLDCQLAILENALTNHLVTGVVPGRLGTRHPSIAPFQAFTTADGRTIVICAGHDEAFAKLGTVLGRADLPRDPRFLSPDARRQNADALEAEIQPILRARPAAEWLEVLERAGVPCAPVNTVAEAVRSPQVAARNMVVSIPDPALGTLFVAGNPVKLSDVPETESHRAPPDLDADRAAIVAWLAHSSRRVSTVFESTGSSTTSPSSASSQPRGRTASTPRTKTRSTSDSGGGGVR